MGSRSNVVFAAICYLSIVVGHAGADDIDVVLHRCDSLFCCLSCCAEVNELYAETDFHRDQCAFGCLVYNPSCAVGGGKSIEEQSCAAGNSMKVIDTIDFTYDAATALDGDVSKTFCCASFGNQDTFHVLFDETCLIPTSTRGPTPFPTDQIPATFFPTILPTTTSLPNNPSLSPTARPSSGEPSLSPTSRPSRDESNHPSLSPTPRPTRGTSSTPSLSPTPRPTRGSSSTPTLSPTPRPGNTGDPKLKGL